MQSRFTHKQLHIAGLVVAIIVLIIWSILMSIYGAERIANWVGVERGLWFMFIVATFGGASTVTTTTFYTTLITLASGGQNPFHLGIVAGLGLVIGDSMFYYLGWSGGGMFGKTVGNVIQKLADWLEKQKKWVVMLFVYVYAGFSPLPNDIMTVAMGLAGYKYKYLFPGLLLGNITISVIVAYLASSGIVS